MRATPTTAVIPALAGVNGLVGRVRAWALEQTELRRRKLVSWSRAFRASGRSSALVGGRVEVQLPGLPAPLLVDASTPWLQEWLAGGEPWARPLARCERWQSARRDLLLLGAAEGTFGFLLQQRMGPGRRVLAVERRANLAPLLFENALRGPFGHRLEAAGSEALSAVAEDPSWHFGLVVIQPEAGVAAVMARLGRLLTAHRPVVLLPLFAHLLEREGSCADAVIGRLRGHGYTLRMADQPDEVLEMRFNGWIVGIPPQS